MSRLLQRELFETKRQLEYFSGKKLSMQLGAEPRRWGVVLMKELIDNALDACETAGTPPDISISLTPHGFTVADNGPGMTQALIERSRDYDTRTSDKTYYVSPSRGQLGNALKCLWAAPYAIDPEAPGCVEVTSLGRQHHISVRVDQIAQEPRLAHRITEVPSCKKGTIITVISPKTACYDAWGQIEDFYKSVRELIESYAAFNPHATFSLQMPDLTLAYPATMPGWSKWRPSDPTSPFWYEIDHLTALIAAYLNRERAGARARTLREFVAEFYGLSASAKQKAVLEIAALPRRYLHDLIEGDTWRAEEPKRLLEAMQRHAKRVNPKALGVLGRDHLSHVLCEQQSCDAETISYKKVVAEASGLPFVLEVACGVYRAEVIGETNGRVMTGINWSATLTPTFEHLGTYLNTALVQRRDPVVVVVHLAIPRPTFRDRGKHALTLPEAIEWTLEPTITQVTRLWTTAKRRTYRSHRAEARAAEEMRQHARPRYPSVKAAAYQVMVEAYLAASGQGRYVAHARQIMYAARRQILAMIDPERAIRGLNDQYFTQSLVPDFMLEHPDLTAGWDVVFDDRGHFREPHRQNGRECIIGLGTLAVRTDTTSWASHVEERIDGLVLPFDVKTKGPTHRYQSVLFVEKEGFDELIQQAQIAERFDIATMSTKGMSNTAARLLVDTLSTQGVTIYVLHDFDKSGFSILHSLRTDTRRYQFTATPKVINLGLTLVDVHDMALQSAPVTYRQSADPKLELDRCGATPEEQAFLVGMQQHNRSTGQAYWTGQRVELTAMTSDQFVAWLERRLTEHGVTKVIPAPDTLAKTYRLAIRTQAINAQLAQLQETLSGQMMDIPDDLVTRVSAALQASPELSWEAAIWNVVQGHEAEA